MANFTIPKAIGRSSILHTRDAVVMIILNSDGKTYEILIDGALFKTSASIEFVISFVEGMLEDDFELEQSEPASESHGSSFEP